MNEIGDGLELRDAVLVAHSVSAMIAVLATVSAPDMFSRLVLIGPSARYIDDIGYGGGFTQERIEQLLQFLEVNYIRWVRRDDTCHQGQAGPSPPDAGA